MMTTAAYVLYSTTRWQDLEDVGNCFIVPTTSITDINQKPKKSKWQSRKNILETHRNMCTALQQLFERSINHAYRLGVNKNTGMARGEFGNDEPPAILEHLNRLYSAPSLQQLEQALLHLHDPIDCNQPVEVMLHITEQVQMFLMEHPERDLELIDVNLISSAMNKVSKCGGLYTMAIER